MVTKRDRATPTLYVRAAAARSVGERRQHREEKKKEREGGGFIGRRKKRRGYIPPPLQPPSPTTWTSARFWSFCHTETHTLNSTVRCIYTKGWGLFLLPMQTEGTTEGCQTRELLKRIKEKGSFSNP